MKLKYLTHIDIMIISKVQIGENIYYQLHAEQVINSIIDKTGIGIWEKQLTLSCWDKIIEDCKQNNYKNKNIVLNFDGIDSCQNNSLKKINSIMQYSQNIVFINVLKKIIEDLGLSFFSNEGNVLIKGTEELFEVFYLTNKTNVKIDESNTQRIFSNAFKSTLLKYLDNNNGDLIYHHSSSVYLTKYIDIKRFISHDKEMFIYAVYQLALKLDKHWRIYNSDKPILICQNLNSSFISSLLSGFCKMDLLILDKIGPINKLYSVLDKKIEENSKYIVVSDLVCLGTEIKVTKNLIEFLGGRYCGNVSIIRIETIQLKDKAFKDTECVFTINRENNDVFGYKILTALNNIEE